jgi:hypothetical protein
VRRSIVWFIVIAAAAVSAFAFDWPLDGGSYRYGFGSPREGFLKGMEFGASGGMVKASDDGELTFAADGESLPGGYRLRGGSMMVIAHASDMTTVYTGMVKGSISSYLKNVRAGDALGLSAAADHSGRGVTFYVFDSKERRFVNPLIIMPGLKDDKAPVIRSVALVLNGVETPLEPPKAVRQASYELVIDAYDISPSGNSSAPFDVRVLIDGSEAAHAVYDAAWASSGISSMFGSTKVAEDSYLDAEGRIRLGPYILSRGRVVLTVAASDYSGNKREQTYSISVQ